MTLSRTDAVARVRRLAGTLGELKARVRQAVAVEAGRAVAEAVKDLLTAVLGGPTAAATHPRPAYHPTRPRWDANDDDEDDWQGRLGDPDDEDDEDRYAPPRPASPPAARWSDAVAAAAAAVRWWAGRRLPGWAGAVAGLVAAGVALAGGPVARAAAAVLAAAADLLPLTACSD